jgi:hypothetical protein
MEDDVADKYCKVCFHDEVSEDEEFCRGTTK